MSDSDPSARQVLQSHWSGVLATHSVKFAGYPFGSLVPFCLDQSGQPLILISRLAQHTQNIKANPKVALTLVETGVAGDVQQQERLTLLAQAQPVTAVAQAADCYYRYFPQACGYHDQLDFEFYQLQVIEGRFIAGFGKIHWLSPDQLITANPFTAEQERDIVSHMNKDHPSALAHYCELLRQTLDLASGEHPVTMVGIDGEGAVLRRADRLLRLGFARKVVNPLEAREQLVALARQPVAS